MHTLEAQVELTTEEAAPGLGQGQSDQFLPAASTERDVSVGTLGRRPTFLLEGNLKLKAGAGSANDIPCN